VSIPYSDLDFQYVPQLNFVRITAGLIGFHRLQWSSMRFGDFGVLKYTIHNIVQYITIIKSFYTMMEIKREDPKYSYSRNIGDTGWSAYACSSP
jgi:hypothetical protein